MLLLIVVFSMVVAPLWWDILIQIGRVTSTIGVRLPGFASHLGRVLFPGAARSSLRLLYHPQRLSTELLVRQRLRRFGYDVYSRSWELLNAPLHSSGVTTRAALRLPRILSSMLGQSTLRFTTTTFGSRFFPAIFIFLIVLRRTMRRTSSPSLFHRPFFRIISSLLELLIIRI